MYARYRLFRTYLSYGGKHYTEYLEDLVGSRQYGSLHLRDTGFQAAFRRGAFSALALIYTFISHLYASDYLLLVSCIAWPTNPEPFLFLIRYVLQLVSHHVWL